MAIERIESASDPRAHRVPRSARRRSSCARGDLFVAEGRLVVRRVIEDSRYRVAVAAGQRGGAERSGADARAPVGATCRSWVCAADVLASVAGYDVHRGCLALVHRPPLTPIDELLPAAEMLVVLEGVTNADNVGSVFRNAAAFGAGGVLLSPTCCDPLYRKAIRTSMGAALRVPFARADGSDWPGRADACPRRRIHPRRADAARAGRAARRVQRAAAPAEDRVAGRDRGRRV